MWLPRIRCSLLVAFAVAFAACNDDGGGGAGPDDDVPDIGGNEPIVSGGGPNLGGFDYGGADGQGGFPLPGLGGMGGMF
jgi:hypothetical protein